MVEEFCGSIASDPMARDGWSSVSGIHVVPPSDVFQTPPSAEPRYTTLTLRGSTARAVTRPDPALPPKFTGCGPIEDHCPAIAVTSAGAPFRRDLARVMLSSFLMAA